MPRPSGKRKATAQALSTALSSMAVNPQRVGMPALDSISFADTAPLAKVQGTYQILRTNEIDSYEGPPLTDSSGVAMAITVSALAATGDNFRGTARKAAKLSIADAPTESFRDVKNLIGSLPAESVMKSHNPPIKTTATSNRVKEEKRNVRVKAFLYAASRENDNDFHLILGRKHDLTPEMYMTMELSGLPPSSSASFPKLKATRDAYTAFFGSNLPGASYDFYDPPIPVSIEGSLFFDMTHASGQRPGPQSLKSRMPTIWEVHPITKIVFEP
jgi:hypothetical protein